MRPAYQQTQRGTRHGTEIKKWWEKWGQPNEKGKNGQQDKSEQ